MGHCSSTVLGCKVKPCCLLCVWDLFVRLRMTRPIYCGNKDAIGIFSFETVPIARLE